MNSESHVRLPRQASGPPGLRTCPNLPYAVFDLGQAFTPLKRPATERHALTPLSLSGMLRGHWRSVQRPPSLAGPTVVHRCSHLSVPSRRYSKRPCIIKATIDLATAEPSTGGISKYYYT